MFWDSSGESAQGAAHLQSPAQLRGRGYVTIAGTWQDLRDQMSLNTRDLRKNVQGREIATIPPKTTGNRA